MTTRWRPIDEAWESFERNVVPANAPAAQRKEMEKSFYAGSASLFHLLISSVDHDTGATGADLQLMDDVQDNITVYYAQLARKAFGEKAD